MLKLAENIRALRKQRNLTQEQLAEVLGSRWVRCINGKPGFPCRR